MMMSFEMGTLSRRKSVSLQDLRKQKTISLPERLFKSAFKIRKTGEKYFSEVRFASHYILEEE